MRFRWNIRNASIMITLKWQVKKTIHNNWHIPLLYVAFGDSFLFVLLGFGFGIDVAKINPEL